MVTSETLKVLMVDPSSQGGIALYTTYLVEQLRQLGIEVALCAGGGRSDGSPGLLSGHWQDGRLPDKTVSFYARRALHLPLQAGALLRAVTAVRPDVVHMQTSVVRRADGLVASLIRLRIPVVVTVHNAIPHQDFSLESRLERARWGAADALIVHNDEARDEVRAAVPSGRVYVIPADLLGDACPMDRRVARARLGLDPDAPLAVSLGLVRPYKGIGLLADAWPAVHAARPDARLYVAGAVQQHFPELDSLSAVPGVEMRLAWLSDEEVNLWAAAADVCVLPYDHGAHSGVLHRAVVNNTPVLAAPCLRDEVERFAAGRVVDLQAGLWSSALVEALGPRRLPPPDPSRGRHMALATRDVYEGALRMRRRLRQDVSSTGSEKFS